MRKTILAVLALLVAFPAFALPKRLTPGSSICWCLCDSAKTDTIVMWVKDKADACGLSSGKSCNAQQANGTFAAGTTKSCDGCQIGSDGNCIAGSSAIKPANATMLPGAPTGSPLQVSPTATTTGTVTRTP